MRGAPAGRALALAIAIAVAPAARADGAPAPPLQAAIFRKVFAYVRTLRASPAPRVIALAGKASAADARAIAEAFRTLGVEATVHAVDAPLPPLDAGTILHVPADCATREVLAAAARAGSLTISADPELVREARAAIALRARHDGRTEIVVHLGRARAERHELSSYLLGVATVWK